MNWYEIFYWVTVADGVKGFFDVFSDIFTTLLVVCAIVLIIFTLYRNSETSEGSDDRVSANFWITNFRKLFVWSLIFTTITWAGFVFSPTKKDALVIIAGGAVGNFVMSDSSAKQIPAELTLLIREKLRSEIQDLKTGISLDTLKDKTKEELIELLKRRK